MDFPLWECVAVWHPLLEMPIQYTIILFSGCIQLFQKSMVAYKYYQYYLLKGCCVCSRLCVCRFPQARLMRPYGCGKIILTAGYVLPARSCFSMKGY